MLLGLVVALPSGAVPAERLAAAIQLETVSPQDPADFRPEPFEALHGLLEREYPKVHDRLTRERVSSWSLLYTWPGTNPDLPPLLLTSHLDVVPVPEATVDSWEQPPFGGVIADGFIWGRGSLDNKSGVIATLEAVESLLGEGFAPKRTVYLAFGHDEEIGGDAGAGAITALLAERGVQLEFSLDEGLAIMQDAMPGLEAPVALVGVAEKGWLTLELTTRAQGGHSSLPPPSGAIGRLARAVQRLEEEPMPAHLDGTAMAMLEALAPELPWSARLAVQQLWLLGPLLERELSANPATNALIRTTTAVTVIEAGDKVNILPRSARALVNFRLAPGDSVESVTERVRRVIDDPEVEIRVVTGNESSAVSSHESRAFRAIESALGEVAPEALVAPALVVGGTDSKHYATVADDSYRFLPVSLDIEDRTRFHGVNERLEIRELERAIAFYRALLQSTAGP